MPFAVPPTERKPSPLEDHSQVVHEVRVPSAVVVKDAHPTPRSGKWKPIGSQFEAYEPHRQEGSQLLRPEWAVAKLSGGASILSVLPVQPIPVLPARVEALHDQRAIEAETAHARHGGTELLRPGLGEVDRGECRYHSRTRSGSR